MWQTGDKGADKNRIARGAERLLRLDIGHLPGLVSRRPCRTAVCRGKSSLFVCATLELQQCLQPVRW